MPCISRTADHPLTPMQRKHLVMLLTAGAVVEAAAMNVHELNRRGRQGFPNTVVIGALVDKGLARKRSRSRRGQRFMVYWLTAAGEREARDCAAQAQQRPDPRPRQAHAREDRDFRVRPQPKVYPGTEID
jgi:hypothetical protein